MQQLRPTKRHHYFLLYILLLFPLLVGIIYFGGYNNAVSAAVSLDTHNAPIDSSSVKSWSHTVTNQPNRILIVGIIQISDTNTSMTFNGQALTRHYTNTSCGSCITSIYYLKNPPVGTYTINVSTSSEMSAASVSLYNVDLNNTFGSVNSSVNHGTLTPILTLTSTNTTQRIINYVGVLGSTASIRPTSGQTFLREHNNPNAAGMHSYLAISDGNASTMPLNWTTVSSGSHVNLGLAVNPAAAPTAIPTPVPGANRNIYTGTVFIDTNRNATRETGEVGYANATVRMNNQSNGQTVNGTTDSAGNYTVEMGGTGTFCIALPTVPSGYVSTTTQGPTKCMTITGNGNTTNNSFDFGIATAATPTPIPPTPTPTPLLYTITGSVYNDTNKNGYKDPGEQNYNGTPSVIASSGIVTNNIDGTYTITQLTPGTVTISSASLPTGYSITYPLNGPPSSFQVIVGPGCNTNGTRGASCQ